MINMMIGAAVGCEIFGKTELWKVSMSVNSIYIYLSSLCSTVRQYFEYRASALVFLARSRLSLDRSPGMPTHSECCTETRNAPSGRTRAI